MATLNRQWLLASRPVGFPKQSDFRLAETPVPAPGPEQMLVRTLWLSVDPYMRGRMNDRKSYSAPVPIGGVMEGGTVARVEASHVKGFKPGDIVESRFGWQDFALSDGRGVRVIDPKLAPIQTALFILGMPGMTAYFGLLDIGAAKAGETVLVSGAAGAVGSLVGQIAKIIGCRAVGIAGGADKVKHVVNDLGFDGAFDYKATSDYNGEIARLCPKGVDVYFDNVGGAITDAAFNHLNVKARVSVCGQISQYNAVNPEQGPRLLFHLIVKQARVEGFLVFQFQDRYREGMAKMAEWLKAGKLKYRETVTQGLENAPQAFMGMLQGDNTGKQLVKIANA
jgi:NADPH-dependent curcumin reductase CurA